MKEQKKDRLGLASANYILLAVALVVLTIGYFIMSQNDITISPILVTLAYVVIIPLGLLYPFKKKD
jgi:membrane protein YdbS with pleckstrin-like domain